MVCFFLLSVNARWLGGLQHWLLIKRPSCRYFLMQFFFDFPTCIYGHLLIGIPRLAIPRGESLLSVIAECCITIDAPQSMESSPFAPQGRGPQFCDLYGLPRTGLSVPPCIATDPLSPHSIIIERSVTMIRPSRPRLSSPTERRLQSLDMGLTPPPLRF